MSATITLTSPDGFSLPVYEARPAGPVRGAIVVIQEIFGVNSHIRAVTDGYAADGYVAVAPAMFDRAQRGYDTGYNQDEIQAGIKVMQSLDWAKTMLDTEAAVKHAAQAGKVGIVGYCWGGTLAWLATRVLGVPGRIAGSAWGTSQRTNRIRHGTNMRTSFPDFALTTSGVTGRELSMRRRLKKSARFLIMYSAASIFMRAARAKSFACTSTISTLSGP